MPKISWQHDGANPKMQLKIQAEPAPKSACLWSANATTRDFRQAKWRDSPLKVTGKSIAAEVVSPAEGFIVFFAELEYEMDDFSYFLSTQLRVAGKEKK